mmetsp:Transcript_27147/g.68474  ORF Transcript_27147/g.68474 Transcript_27147/m.68474 type:complete len:221 (+) Transcript_27147:1269-1931(+)
MIWSCSNGRAAPHCSAAGARVFACAAGEWTFSSRGGVDLRRGVEGCCSAALPPLRRTRSLPVKLFCLLLRTSSLMDAGKKKGHLRLLTRRKTLPEAAVSSSFVSSWTETKAAPRRGAAKPRGKTKLRPRARVWRPPSQTANPILLTTSTALSLRLLLVASSTAQLQQLRPPPSHGVWRRHSPSKNRSCNCCSSKHARRLLVLLLLVYCPPLLFVVVVKIF